ncbi:MAG: helix-turn-helix domain-containing protein [Brachymonas sp.]|nr:helix-turn-helix domain-containing protein [Brachymonas sp.]
MPIRFADTAQEALDASKSAGQMLREAREAHGLHVAALAVSMKVPVKKLEALEADRLEDLPDAVFVRALASSVCRALKIDAAPILAKLPQLNTRVSYQQKRRECGLSHPPRWSSPLGFFSDEPPRRDRCDGAAAGCHCHHALA